MSDVQGVKNVVSGALAEAEAGRCPTGVSFLAEDATLYSYGPPSAVSSNARRVVYVVEAEEFTSRGVHCGSADDFPPVEVVVFPLHPALNALEPLRVFERRAAVGV